MRACMGELSDKQRRVLDLHYQHGLQCKEIARRMDSGFEAIKKHLQRGRAVLMRCIQSKVGGAMAPAAGGDA